MIELTGNIWEHARGSLVVIPTNIGWRGDGHNVMGRGLAKDAKLRIAGLAEWYGDVCRRFREETPVIRYFRSAVLLFPVKPLAKDSRRSWNQKADFSLIVRSARQLSRWFEMTEWRGGIVLPTVGCGAGGLKEPPVLRILRRTLRDDRFVLVRRKA